MKTVMFIAFMTCWLHVTAQQPVDFNNYTPLKCQGPIPQDFTEQLAQAVQATRDENAGKTKSDQKLEVAFSELSNHGINNILFSGNVLYGDRITEYVNHVADNALKQEPELRAQLHFYILKNTSLNAYSTQKGIIFISLGLLSQIENEAQLAFIICHEAIHFRNNHNLESYKNKKQILSEDKNAPMPGADKLHQIFNYSKDNENEADKEGLKLFLKSSYSTKSLNSLFDVMLYSYLPFDEIPFDSAYFNTNSRYVLPLKLFRNKVSEISAEEDVADSMSTHPNIKTRREAIQQLLKEYPSQEKTDFLLPIEEFKTIQHMARCEVAILHLENAELEDAFYNAYLLEKTYGSNLFSDKIKGSAIYGMSKQKNNYDNDLDDEDERDWNSVEGESQAVFYFFHKISSKELNVLAARNLYQMYLLHHEAFFLDRFKSTARELVTQHSLNFSDFLPLSSEQKDTLSGSDGDSLKNEEAIERSGKIAKIKKQKKQKKKESVKQEKNYYKFGFAEFLKDSLIMSAFREFETEYENTKELEDNVSYQNYKRDRDKLIEKQGEAVGVDTLVMISPFYSSYSLKYYSYIRNPYITPLKEEKIEQKLTSYLIKDAEKLHLSLTVIGSAVHTEMQTDDFNDYQQLVKWLQERTNLGKMGAYTYNDQYVSEYISRYGYLGYCSIVNLDEAMYVKFILFNLSNNGSALVYKKTLKRARPESQKVHLILYDILYQIKQKPTKINKLKRKYGITEN